MHQRLCTNYIFVDRETVRVVLKSLNLEEVSFWHARQFHQQKYRAEGPNQLWYYGLKFVIQIKIPFAGKFYMDVVI